MATAKQLDFLLVGHHKTDGTLNSSGVVYFYESGTSTPKNAYDGPDTVTDNAITSVTLDAAGKATAYGYGTYRLVIKDSDGNTIGTYDGMNYEIPSSSLNAVQSITNTDSPYNTTTSNYTILANATAGAIVVNLYTAVGNAGRRLFIKKTDSSANTVTITPNGAQTIDLDASRVFSSQHDWIEIESDGTNLTVVAGNTFSIIKVDTIYEKTAGSGITADGVLLKDNNATVTNLIANTQVQTDTIVEKTGGNGIVVDSFKIKDNAPDPTSWPCFHVYRASDQLIVPSTWTKVVWSVEVFDTNSNFATGTFTPTVAGKYFLSAALWYASIEAQKSCRCAIYKNGVIYVTNILVNTDATTGRTMQPQVTVIVDANGTTDYFDVYAYHDSTLAKDITGSNISTWFSGSRIA